MTLTVWSPREHLVDARLTRDKVGAQCHRAGSGWCLGAEVQLIKDTDVVHNALEIGTETCLGVSLQV